jgi:hypothetical protein
VAVRKPNDDEDDGQKDEAHQLDGFAADSVDSCNSDPVTGDGTGADDDQVANSRVAEDFINVVALGVTNGLKNDGVVETKAIEGDIC